MSNVRQTSVTKQRFSDHISKVTGKHDDRYTVPRGVVSPVRREVRNGDITGEIYPPAVEAG
jgi:hypothetical protein